MRKEDLDHLKLLSVFHYVCAGLTILASLIPVLYLALGLAILVSPEFVQKMEGEVQPDQTVAVAFVLVTAVLLFLGVAIALCLFFAGRCLARQTHYIFCKVIAVLECLWFPPFGTVLGILNLVVLSRESVKQLFGCAGPVPSIPDHSTGLS